MRSPTFLQGIGVAALASMLGAALFSTLAMIHGPGLVLRALIALLGLSYLLWLLGRSQERSGRVTVVLLWLLAAGVCLALTLPLPLYLLIHTGLIWLIRSLYYYSGILPALMDLGLSGLALATAVWAVTWSSSVLLAIWCFFLVQALFVAIPADLRRAGRDTLEQRVQEDRFQHARRAAEAALRRLAAHS